jgi:protein O-mannosyl-transferase
MVIDYALGRGAPRAFHVTNVLLHVGCVLLFWRLLLALGIGDATAFGLALVFGTHPVGAEAITWINGRSEPLCLVFGLATLLLCARTGRLTAPALAGIASASCLSLLGKETGIVFFVIGLGLLLRRADRQALRSGSLALLVGAGSYLALRTAALSHSRQTLALSLQIAAAIPALWFRALEAALVPIDLGLENLPAWLQTTTAAAMVAFFLVAAALVCATVLAWLRRRTLEALGLAWWLAMLAPPSLTLATGGFWPGLCRWVYLALPGLLLAFASLLDRWLPRRWAYGAFALIALLLALESQRTISLWRSDESLLQDMIARYPNDTYAPYILAQYRRGRREAGWPRD